MLDAETIRKTHMIEKAAMNISLVSFIYLVGNMIVTR
jgi:hypothetical protein